MDPPPQPPPYALLWDLDGTVMDSEPFNNDAVVAAIREFNPPRPLTDEVVEQTRGESRRTPGSSDTSPRLPTAPAHRRQA